MNNWIEPILERELRGTRAPAELWDRVSKPRPTLRWQLVFALTLAVATAWAIHPRTIAIDSNSAAEIRNWVEMRTGLVIPLAPSAGVQLCGARVFGSSAEIRFRASGRESTLLVAKADKTGPSHQFNGSSWTLHGQTYSSDVHAACLLCHEE